jgi:hypothetical protein
MSFKSANSSPQATPSKTPSHSAAHASGQSAASLPPRSQKEGQSQATATRLSLEKERAPVTPTETCGADDTWDLALFLVFSFYFFELV